MVVLLTCKNEEDPKGARGKRDYTSIFNILKGSLLCSPWWNPAIQAIIVDLVTCKNEEDPIKKTLESNNISSDAQGQLTCIPLSNRDKILTHPRYYGFPLYLQE